MVAFLRLVAVLLPHTTSLSKDVPMVVIFGRPGAGKTTVADGAAGPNITRLDLDVCVPQWMRDNFAAGIYPNLAERQAFAGSACEYVDQCLQEKDTVPLAAIVSFSFVNTDLRDIFRAHFPQAKWILIDTTEDESQRRIQERQGHFFKGNVTESAETKSPSTTSSRPEDDSDWEFAPVSFPHIVLDGGDPVDVNAKRTLQVLERLLESDH
jgi:gluconate kinase